MSLLSSLNIMDRLARDWEGAKAMASSWEEAANKKKTPQGSTGAPLPRWARYTTSTELVAPVEFSTAGAALRALSSSSGVTH